MYEVIAGLTGVTADAFYRRVALPGGGDIPAGGPVLLVANHPNGLVDPIIVVRVVGERASGRRVRMLAKAPLFDMPGISLLVKGVGALPVYRAKDGADTRQNEATFRAVNDALLEHSAVLIFPEGISHDEPQLQKLKTGAARMALQACHAGAVDLVVVPIGLVYRDKERFRSEVATLIGAPIAVGPYLEKTADPEDAATVNQLTEDIAAALLQTTVNLEAWEDLPLLEAVDAVWRIDDPSRTIRIKQLADGVRVLRTVAPERLEDVRARVVDWTTRLAELGLAPRALSPEQVDARAQPALAVSFVLRNLALALVGLPVATFGAVFFAVPFWSVHLLSLVFRPSRDVAATVKVLASLVFFPLWHVFAAIALWRWVGPEAALTLAGLAPFAGMTTRWFFRGRRRALRDAGAFVSLLLRRDLAQELLRERDRIVQEMEDLAALVAKAEDEVPLK